MACWLFATQKDGISAQSLQRELELAVGHEPVRYRDLVVDPHPKKRPPAGRAGWGHPPTLDRPRAFRPWRAA
jgi:hypothetical protein